MEIAENNAQRLTLVKDVGSRGVLGLICLLFVCALLAVVGLATLFGNVAELVTPGWAESNGWDGLRWQGKEGEPDSIAYSIFCCILVTPYNLAILWSVSTRLLFRTRQRLVIDFRNGQALLTSRGLFLCPDRTYLFSSMSASIEEHAGEEDATYQVLIVTAAEQESKQGNTDHRLMQRILWTEEITRGEADSLHRLTRALPSSRDAGSSLSVALTGT